MSKDAPISVGKLLSQYLLAVITALPAQEQPSVLSSAEWELAQSQKQLLSETPGLTHDVIWVFVLWLAAVSPCCISPKLDAFITKSKGLTHLACKFKDFVHMVKIYWGISVIKQ